MWHAREALALACRMYSEASGGAWLLSGAGFESCGFRFSVTIAWCLGGCSLDVLPVRVDWQLWCLAGVSVEPRWSPCGASLRWNSCSATGNMRLVWLPCVRLRARVGPLNWSKALCQAWLKHRILWKARLLTATSLASWCLGLLLVVQVPVTAAAATRSPAMSMLYTRVRGLASKLRTCRVACVWQQ